MCVGVWDKTESIMNNLESTAWPPRATTTAITTTTLFALITRRTHKKRINIYKLNGVLAIGKSFR